MKSPKYTDFPESEYRDRVRKTARLLKEENLDGMILTQSENIYYLTGTHDVMAIHSLKDMQPTVIVLMEGEEPVLVTRWEKSHPVLQETFWPENVVTMESGETVTDAVVRALKEYRFQGNRLGMELGGSMRLGLSINEYHQLVEDIIGSLRTEIVDGSGLVWRLRHVKSKFEIERLRKAVQATCKAFEYAIENVEVGINLLELSQKAGAVMMEEGTYWRNTQFFFPPLHSCGAWDIKLPKGWACWDFGAEYKHYVADMHRDVLVGRKPTEVEKQLYDVRVGANELIESEVRPGLRFDDLVTKLNAFVEESGCFLPKKFAGHGIGLDSHEVPVIALSKPEPWSGLGMPGYPTRFEVGMTFALEPLMYHPELPYRFNVEDDAVVTENGCELLAEFPREMPVVI